MQDFIWPLLAIRPLSSAIQMTRPLPPPVEPEPSHRHALWQTHIALALAALLALFAGRVAAQLIQRYWPTDALPDFAAWHSGLLPYEFLLISQLLIVAAFAVITVRVASGRVQPRSTVATVLLSMGAIYFAVMSFRLGGALTNSVKLGPLSANPLPAAFHLVLSAWLLVLGLYHERGSRAASAAGYGVGATLVHWLTYPVLIASCLFLHYFLLEAGLSLLLASYIPVAFGALTITLLERTFPHREEWQPNHHDVASDVTFMVFVQILLPKVLSLFAAVTLLRFLQEHGIVLHGIWPHHLPAVAQAALMLLAADFLRYWLHRASHEWSPLLWRLHAVHHSPPKLYWVNVGRFHPIEKAIQFLCDAAPFILFGVSENVLALYFVFYAVNGFFQHCNIEVRLGVLNTVISGPELHRWHHSREVRESNKNYGNNVILWDLLFRSYFLPKNQSVATLGLMNRNYPLGFLRQLRTPFVKGLDQEQE